MRLNLKLLRVQNNLTQEEFAEKVGVSRGVYSNIENSKVNGTMIFWDNVQKAFEVPDEKMYSLMKDDERTGE